MAKQETTKAAISRLIRLTFMYAATGEDVRARSH